MEESMELEQAIENVLDGQAVLFAGAGFSYGAKNINGDVPSAKMLKKELLRSMGMNENVEYGLEMVADFYKKKKSATELVNKLREQYNILSVAEHHKKIMGLQWKRVYTTNYDQVIEKASIESGAGYCRDAIILSDDFESSSKNLISVHLNGYIERLNVDKLENEFKLTDHSYSCDTLVRNPWFEFMVNDFEAASVIIVIGYSMLFDIDIKRLFSAPEISRKVIFIDSPEIDEMSKGLLENYGACYPIGIDEFSNKIDVAKKDYVPSMSFSYKSFKCMYHDTLTSLTPSYEDIVKFYVEGKRCEKLLEKDISGEYKYVLNRKAMDLFLRGYRNNKVYIALSNLGNGKTIFIDMVENELRSEDVKVFTYIHRYDLIDQEIESICEETKKCVVIIDNYPGHMDILNKFAQYGHSNITFLLTARNGVNLMFCKQLERALHIESEDIHPLYLNQLQKKEIDDLVSVLENNSLLTAALDDVSNGTDLNNFIANDCKANFSNLLLKLFESSNIKKKLERLYDDLEKSENLKVKEVAIFSLLKNISNYDLNFHEILDLFGADYIAFKRNDIEFIPEIFEQGDENAINVRSSIISLSLLKNIIKMEDVIKTMKKVFLAADNKSGRTYIELQKSMISHSQFLFLSSTSDKRDNFIQIENFYNDIRNTKFAKHNPFFWEQFASAYIDMKKYDLVKKCVDTALVEAKRTKSFVPFQVKTVQGRYYVEKCYDDLLHEKINTNEAIEAVVDATDAVLLYYNHPENNLYYVFKVVRFYPLIFNIIKNLAGNRELSIYIEKSSIMKSHMDDYLADNVDSQYYEKVNKWKQELIASINEAKKLLK
jgi:hypothetical protein